MTATPNQPYPVQDSQHTKEYCKQEFTSIFNEIREYRRNDKLTDQDVRILLSTLLAYYMACLVETDFETKMARWSDRLLSHWVP